MLERAVVQEIVLNRDTGLSVLRECPRPEEVRSIAIRLRKWTLEEPERCHRCDAAASVYYRERAYCRTCRAKEERHDPFLTSTRSWAEFRAALQDRQVLRGEAIVFNQPSVDLGGFVETIRPSAVDRLFRERTDVQALWSHDPSLGIGRMSAGTLALSKSPNGLLFAIDPPSWGDRYVESIQRRDVIGVSFGFRAIEDEWMLVDGYPMRYVLDMDTHEISPVSFPAYTKTRVSVAHASSLEDMRAMMAIKKRLDAPLPWQK